MDESKLLFISKTRMVYTFASVNLSHVLDPIINRMWVSLLHVCEITNCLSLFDDVSRFSAKQTNTFKFIVNITISHAPEGPKSREDVFRRTLNPQGHFC